MKTLKKLSAVFGLLVLISMAHAASAQTYDAPTYRGKVILVVDKTITADSQVAVRIDRLTQDLTGDGWRILRHDVERGPTFTLGASRPPFQAVNDYADWEQQNAPRIREVRALIKADYDAAPDEVKNVILIGHIPVPYSGNNVSGNVGGHYLGAKPADAFYGDMLSPYGAFGWTDSLTAPATYSIDPTTGQPRLWKQGDVRPNGHTSSDVGYRNGDVVVVENTGLVRQCDNHPYDGKFDQDSMPSPMKLGVGRIDFFRMTEFGVNETTLIARYLDKDHDFRCGNFQVQRRAVFAGQLSADSTGASHVFGGANTATFFNYSDDVNSSSHWLWFPNVKNSGQDYLLGYAGGVFVGYPLGIGLNAGNSQNDFLSQDSRVVFVNLAGSFLNNWESEVDFLRVPLANPYDPSNGRYGYGLTTSFSWDTGFGLDENSLTKRALGSTIGEALFKDYTGDPNHALMGDPTLRMHTVLPPGTPTISIGANMINLNWNASADSGATYNVYRSPTLNGPFTLVNSGGPITGTGYETARPVTGVPDNFYMVRAVKTETVLIAPYSYVNLSEGVTIKVPGAATAYLNIQNQPVTQYLMANTGDGTANSAAFSVDAIGCDAAGNGQLFYQWYKGGVAIPVDDCHIKGATTRTLLITGVNANDAGSYSVVVRNIAGSLTSSSASLTLVTAQPVATSDSTDVYRNTPKDINVLANDTPGFSGATMKIVSVSPLSKPYAGTISINADQTIHYVPARTFLETVTFTYKMTDGVNIAQATVTINMLPMPGNVPPTITFSPAVDSNQTITERTAYEFPFTVSDDYTTSENLILSVTSSSQSVFCEVIEGSSGKKLRIAGNMPVTGTTVILSYKDEDNATTTATFQVTVSPDSRWPQLGGATYSSSASTFTFTANGAASSVWTVYASTDLQNWTAAGSVTLNGSGAGSFTDSGISGLMYKFYKLSNGTYTTRAIGFEREVVGVGTAAGDHFSSIANQLDVSGDNSFSTVFAHVSALDGTAQALPNGTKVEKYSSENASFHIYQYSSSTGAWTPVGTSPASDETLSPGEGAFIQNNTGTPFVLTFAGLVREGRWNVSLGNGFDFVSAMTPKAGGVISDLGCHFEVGDEVRKWSGSGYFNYIYIGAENLVDFPDGWIGPDDSNSTEPTISVGEGFFFVNSQGQPESWIQNYSPVGGNVPALSSDAITSSAFTFTANGAASSVWTVYASTDLQNWTAAGSVTLNGSGAGSFTDSGISGLMYKFYKLSDGTYTSRAIGFEREVVGVGTAAGDHLSSIANQLDVSPDSSFSSVFAHVSALDGTTQSLPNGTKVEKYSSENAGFHIYQYSSSTGSWTPVGTSPVSDEALSPGEAAFIQNNTGAPFVLTFAGLVREGQWNVLLGNGYNFVSAMTPKAGGVISDLGCHFEVGDEVLKWSGSGYSYYTYIGTENLANFPDGWIDSDDNASAEPTIGVGEGFFFVNGQGYSETWNQNYSAHQ